MLIVKILVMVWITFIDIDKSKKKSDSLTHQCLFL